jgi:hypothetical protein
VPGGGLALMGTTPKGSFWHSSSAFRISRRPTGNPAERAIEGANFMASRPSPRCLRASTLLLQTICRGLGHRLNSNPGLTSTSGTWHISISQSRFGEGRIDTNYGFYLAYGRRKSDPENQILEGADNGGD